MSRCRRVSRHAGRDEKQLRDARASLIEDGCNEVLALHAAEKF
jgi:hypothetical protein